MKFFAENLFISLFFFHKSYEVDQNSNFFSLKDPLFYTVYVVEYYKFKRIFYDIHVVHLAVLLQTELPDQNLTQTQIRWKLICIRISLYFFYTRNFDIQIIKIGPVHISNIEDG